MPKKIETELLLLPHGYEMRWEGKYSWFMLDYWVTRLEEITSFRFSGKRGSFTARKEKRSKKCYWYAYARVGDKLRKLYLGKSEGLDISWLETVAHDISQSDE